ncbi:hypothetical protein ACFLT8_01060 [Chloroflexota bacterium]
MLTIFSTTKPFIENTGIIQTNALRSWAALKPACEIILFDSDEGTARIIAELGIRQVTQIERNEYGTPLVSSMFKIAQNMANNKFLCYVNADIILMSEFVQALSQIDKQFFLMVGRRWDMDISEILNFQNTDWEEELKNRVVKEGRLHRITGVDYFVFPKGLYEDMPPLAIGRPGWDNWLIYHSRFRKIPVIDASSMVTAIHQNHGYASFSGGDKGFWEGPEAKRNAELIGGVEHAFHLGFTDWTLTVKGLRPARSWQSTYFKIRALPVLHPRLHFLMPLVRFPGKIVGAIRSR